jgi:hypothetical protein
VAGSGGRDAQPDCRGLGLKHHVIDAGVRLTYTKFMHQVDRPDSRQETSAPSPATRTQRRRILGKLLELLLTPLGVTVQTELPVMSKPPKADILLVRRSGGLLNRGATAAALRRAGRNAARQVQVQRVVESGCV